MIIAPSSLRNGISRAAPRYLGNTTQTPPRCHKDTKAHKRENAVPRSCKIEARPMRLLILIHIG